MPWSIENISNHGYTLILYTGIVTENELMEAFQAFTEILKKNKSNINLILADCTDMQGGHSIFDLYKLISLYEDTGLNRNFKEALLLPNLRDSVENVLFYETTCLKRGYNVKICKEYDEAVKWLLE